MTKRILVVDDDTKILKAVGEALRQEGYDVQTAADGPTALAMAQERLPDLLVLDINLPGIDGFDVCTSLRRSGAQTPILILSARGDETDRVVGFRLGADDYLTKPFSIAELVLRVKAILRRSAPTPGSQHTNRIAAGDLVMDLATHQATMRGERIDLTPREFDMLWLMASHPSQVFSRETLLERIWHSDFDGDQQAVTVYIRRLREKIERNPGDPAHIKTVWGIGYKFEP